MLLRKAAMKAMAYAAARDADLLWLEDDIRADDRIVDALALCVGADHPVTLFVSDLDHHPQVVRDAMVSGRPMPLQIHEIPAVGSWWGSQAVYIPRRCMRLLASSPYMLGSYDALAFDTAIRNIYRDHDLPLYGVFPNPVQHMNEPSARKVTRDEPLRRERVSPTYGWATA